MRGRFRSGHEPSADTDRVGACRQGRCHGPAGTDASCSNQGQGDGSPHFVQEWQESKGAPDVSASLDPLGDDQIASGVASGPRLVGGADLPSCSGSSFVHGRDHGGIRLPQKNSTSGLLVAASSSARRSRKGTRKFTPTGTPAGTASSCAARASAPMVPLSMPRAPATETAMARSGVANPPMPACCNGYRQWNMSVKRVVIATGLSCPGSEPSRPSGRQAPNIPVFARTIALKRGSPGGWRCTVCGGSASAWAPPLRSQHQVLGRLHELEGGLRRSTAHSTSGSQLILV